MTARAWAGYTPALTLYWRSVRRVKRRTAARWCAWAALDGSPEAQARALRADQMLREAVAQMDRLALLAR